jgi:hypothetical protein
MKESYPSNQKFKSLRCALIEQFWNFDPVITTLLLLLFLIYWTSNEYTMLGKHRDI